MSSVVGLNDLWLFEHKPLLPVPQQGHNGQLCATETTSVVDETKSYLCADNHDARYLVVQRHQSTLSLDLEYRRLSICEIQINVLN